MDKELLYELLDKNKDPNTSDLDYLKEATEKFPFFEAAKFLYLKTLYKYDPERFKNELEKQSILLSNREDLFYYIFRDEYASFFIQTGKKRLDTDRTNLLLDAFFENREPETSFLEYETSSINNLVSTDYLSFLNMEEEKDTKEGNSIQSSNDIISDSIHNIQDYFDLDEPKNDLAPLKHQNIIDKFLKKADKDDFALLLNREELKNDKDYLLEEEKTEKTELDDDTFFTETLAKIYTKQGKYEKAYEIIKHLSLNYPKKNSYFADQLNYLEKLIINSQYRNRKK